MTPEAAAQNLPAHPHANHANQANQINRRRLLLSAAGGIGALAVAGGARWWAGRDAEHGPRLWSTTAATGRVLLADGPRQGLYASGDDGTLHALDPRTGAVRWSRVVDSPTPETDGMGGRPSAMGDGAVYTAASTGLRALDAATGEVRWQVPVPEWAELPIGQEPLAAGGGGVFAVHGGALHAYDPATGTERWSTTSGAGGFLAADGDAVYTGGAGARAFDARTGEQRWVQETVPGVNSTPVVHRGAVLLTYPGGTATTTWVCSLEAATGRVRWQRMQRGASDRPLSAADGTVCFLSGTQLVGMDTETGEPRWTATVTLGLGRGQSSMLAANGTAYVGTNDDRLFAFDLATGSPRWQDAPDNLRSDAGYTHVSLAAAGSTVYRSSRTGLHALGTLT
ncbi:PQQ-binding-like beta-propeller repeat protein [Kitasatospora sp. NPDC098652]|uniref:outer membrane protein assembly factor BamB family protein n=1 Tax=Kitasatospora sp. NPDC098652 TaxID=3364095 RepID=UPI00381A7C0D